MFGFIGSLSYFRLLCTFHRVSATLRCWSLVRSCMSSTRTCTHEYTNIQNRIRVQRNSTHSQVADGKQIISSAGRGKCRAEKIQPAPAAHICTEADKEQFSFLHLHSFRYSKMWTNKGADFFLIGAYCNIPRKLYLIIRHDFRVFFLNGTVIIHMQI